jgi:cathepsin X
MRTCVFLGAFIVLAAAYRSEFIELPGHTVKNDYTSPLPHEYIDVSALPQSFDWGNVNGTSYITKSLNQHLPQYCGSCWAHGALSSLADRIKIARKAQGQEINLNVQYILNCGTEIAGSCHGGSATGTYEFIKKSGFVPYDTCLAYEACSQESSEGFCSDGDYTCKPINTCRTCSTFSADGGKCVAIDYFPNASIAEYGTVTGADKMKAEIYKRGPIAAGVNAVAILDYHGGIINDPSASKEVDHIVSITGWGYDKATGDQYWNVRNSWGQYWGELSFFRVKLGENQLGLEEGCSWATPASFTELNVPCNEDGSNCQSSEQNNDILIA